MARSVQTPAAALSRTRTPVADSMSSGERRARAISVGDGLQNVIAGLGTGRDKTSYSGYDFPRLLGRGEMDNAYRCSWLAKRVINSWANAMTREWRDLVFEEQGKGSKGTSRHDLITQAEKAYGVKTKFNHAIRWGRLYGGCLVVYGVRNDDLSMPLDVKTIRQGDLKWMRVIDRWRCSAGPLNTDLASPLFGLPNSYLIAESSVQVHASRVNRFNGETLPYFPWTANGYWDDSILQHILTSMQNCDASSQLIASMMFEANVDVVSGSNVTETLAVEGGEDLLKKRWQLTMLMKGVNRTLLLDSEEKYEKKATSFANLDKVWEKFQVDFCGAAETPMTVLFGQSPGGMNATGDADTRGWYDSVSEKQETDLRPQLEYHDEIMVRSVLGTMPGDFSWTFNPLWQTSDAEQATVNYQQAQTDQIYLTTGVLSEGSVARELKSRGTYHTMTDDDVDLAEELAQAPEPPLVQPGLIKPALPAPGPSVDASVKKQPAVPAANVK